ncbi:protein SOSEKI 4-like [Prosopis cineraria]|uniref:protein SOSEKI 4-like n=1 Tax=Prosopis cineraria TaxID=364024 RepID=UPI0024103FFB|nr:protein SOSEKI 4-like [Prosopis cineraria]XP_054787937.1 protein SOSEKI 4-like [Prosopis cineraria]XP_054787938.1 protein SOSEKI 4-like [Prosopis cineraria]XP_054787939.1 protein SOSEKI 4-like [Prosopis cineraria]
MARKILEREESGVKGRIWGEEEAAKERKEVKAVNVIYYLARNGQLEHPHLMEVPVSSSQGLLCLKDVINRLSFLRGQGMAHSYSWSAKRSYKKGYVWQDLSENDFIYPCNAHDEFILKGTQLIQFSSSSFRSNNEAVTLISPSSSKYSSETTSFISTDTDSPETTKKTTKTKKEPWNKLAAINASTQTDVKERNDEEVVVEEISNGEAIGLPVSGNVNYDSSSADIREYCRIENENQSARMKASTVLMQLIRCVSSKKLHDSEHVRAER